MVDTLPTNQRKTVVDMLLEANLLTNDQLLQAQDAQRKSGHKIEDVLVEEQLVDPEQVALLSSLQLGVPFVNLKKQEVDPRAIELVPESVCRQHVVVPLHVQESSIVIAMQDPSNIQVVDTLAAQTRKRIEPVFALTEDILEAIDINYRVSGEIEKQLSQLPTFQGIEESQTQLSAEAIAQAACECCGSGRPAWMSAWHDAQTTSVLRRRLAIISTQAGRSALPFLRRSFIARMWCTCTLTVEPQSSQVSASRR